MTINKLQRAQNNAARVVLDKSRRVDAKPLLRQLHWLPIQQRIVYKMAVLTRKAHTTGVPAYLTLRVATRHTRSAALPLLNLASLSTDFARRSFSYAAPKIWNSLPTEISSCNSEATFKKHIFTRIAFIPSNWLTF